MTGRKIAAGFAAIGIAVSSAGFTAIAIGFASSSPNHLSRSAIMAREPEKLNDPCEPGVDLRASQLCAQWKAADAAVESARWAWIGGLLSIISVGGVFGALSLAYQANRIAKDTAIKESRAYVEVYRSQGGMNPSYGGFHLCFKNYGKTPARDFRYEARMGAFLFPLPENTSIFDYAPLEVGRGDTKMTLSPDDDPIECGAVLYGEQTATQIQQVLNEPSGAFRVYVFGKTRYLDVYGEERWTTFCARLARNGPNGFTSTWTYHDNDADRGT